MKDHNHTTDKIDVEQTNELTRILGDADYPEGVISVYLTDALLGLVDVIPRRESVGDYLPEPDEGCSDCDGSLMLDPEEFDEPARNMAAMQWGVYCTDCHSRIDEIEESYWFCHRDSPSMPSDPGYR